MRTKARSAVWAGGDVSAVAGALREMDADVVAALHRAGYGAADIDVRWDGEFKYAGQQWELPVPIPRTTDLTADDLAAAQTRLARRALREASTARAARGSAARSS